MAITIVRLAKPLRREFHGVQVVMGTGRKPEINIAQFYQSLVDSMSGRLLPEIERSLVSALATVFPSTWPARVVGRIWRAGA